MKKPLAVGDRVSVTGYLCWLTDTWTLQTTPVHGTIINIFEHEAYIETSSGSQFKVFKGQCRRLIPRKPRREVWHRLFSNGAVNYGAATFGEPSDPHNWVRFVEARGKKK